MLLVSGGVLLSQTEAPQDGMSAFGKMVPADFVNRDVIIPSFNAEGRKSSVAAAKDFL